MNDIPSITWHHMSGAGNTFLVGALESKDADVFEPQQIRRIIDDHPRSDNAAVEGVLALRSFNLHSFEADYYNPDGSFGMMCGNGSRCITRFAIDRGVSADGDIFFTLNGNAYIARSNADGTISVDFAEPVREHLYEVGELQSVVEVVYYVDVHSDHVVIDGPLDASRNVVRTLRSHPEFDRGVNVNMVDVDSPSTVHIATFERGVEAITGACGTGAISTAVALWRMHRTNEEIVLTPPSGRPLHVKIHHDGDRIRKITLTGDATYDDYQ